MAEDAEGVELQSMIEQGGAIERKHHKDIAELLDSAPHSGGGQSAGPGRRVVQRAGEGLLVETRSYKQPGHFTEFAQVLQQAQKIDSGLEEYHAQLARDEEALRRLRSLSSSPR